MAPASAPTAPGYQSALVVADDGGPDVLSSDALGRIKVKFHWQSGDGHTAERSCWLRVSQRYAGPGVGAQFLPRVGQEVLVAFLEGDVDRSVVVGALGKAGKEAAADGADLYAQASDHGPSAQANRAGGHAPPWHGMGAGDDAHRNASALWGIQSQEWHGPSHSRPLFDDSDGQLRAWPDSFTDWATGLPEDVWATGVPLWQHDAEALAELRSTCP